MFGTIELEFLDGPVFLDHDYLADGRILRWANPPRPKSPGTKVRCGTGLTAGPWPD